MQPCPDSSPPLRAARRSTSSARSLLLTYRQRNKGRGPPQQGRNNQGLRGRSLLVSLVPTSGPSGRAWSSNGFRTNGAPCHTSEALSLPLCDIAYGYTKQVLRTPVAQSASGPRTKRPHRLSMERVLLSSR